MRRAKALGLAGAGVSLAVSATIAATSATMADTVPAAEQNQLALLRAVPGGTVQVPPGQARAASVTCPAGHIVTGGGGSTSGNQVFLTTSILSGNGWTVVGRNTGRGSAAIRAVAVCLRAS